MRERAQPGKPDLVDLAGIGERLGVAPATVVRWHRRSTLPAPDLTIGRLELWMWETIRQWGRQRSRFSRRREQPVPIPDIVDAGQIADRLDVDVRAVENWLRTGSFPRPDYRWDGTEAWLWDTVARWSEASLPQVPQLHPSYPPRGPSLHATAPPAPTAEVAPPAFTEVTVAPSRSRDPVGDIDRIHRHFSELARSLDVSNQAAPPDQAAVKTIP